jgi:lipopolysaccharide/colanic/teichoic acid biosynthesis glycosyltransferase
MVPIILALALTGEHQIFYLQKRIGKGGRDFRVIKFVTMQKDSLNLPGGDITQKDDPRVLALGRLLRKTKINELPQLLNILIGQMSFVGPRPVVRRHLELYSEAVRTTVLTMAPGLTGIASLVFRNEEVILDKMGGDRMYYHDSVFAPYKGELEIWYSKNRNARVYFLTILLTAWAVLRPNSRLHFSKFKDLPEPPEAFNTWL